MSELTDPLPELLRKDTDWTWDTTHDKGVKKMKTTFSNAPVLKIYDINEMQQFL